MIDASGTQHAIDIMIGNFGEADPEITKTTGHISYNVQFWFSYGKTTIMKEPGVISEDGFKIRTNPWGSLHYNG